MDYTPDSANVLPREDAPARGKRPRHFPHFVFFFFFFEGYSMEEGERGLEGGSQGMTKTGNDWKINGL